MEFPSNLNYGEKSLVKWVLFLVYVFVGVLDKWVYGCPFSESCAFPQYSISTQMFHSM